MSTTVTYKGETLTTVSNDTATLETSGTWLEDDITLTDVTSGGTMQAKTNISPTTSSQTITPDVGYDGLSSVQINAMPTGTAGTPTATKGTVSNHSVSVTPSVTNTTGYITGSTINGTAVTVSASELDSGSKSITANGNSQDVVGYASVDVAVPNSYSASDEGKVVSSGALVAQTAHADVTPTTSDQTIDTTTNNSIKVKGDADLVAGNIKKDVEIFGVTGSYEGGGGSLGGLANMVDVSTIDYQLAYMLMCMKKGDTTGGTITYTTAFPNTSTLLISTGLTTVHGIIFAATAMDFNVNEGASQSNKMLMLFKNTEDTYNLYGIQSQTTSGTMSATKGTPGTAQSGSPTQGTLTFSGGDIYYTARYNGNASYQILQKDKQFEWLAW